MNGWEGEEYSYDIDIIENNIKLTALGSTPPASTNLGLFPVIYHYNNSNCVYFELRTYQISFHIERLLRICLSTHVAFIPNFSR